jgi:H+/Cl- antiporter ClcA
MARKGKSSGWFPWFRHRWLVEAEAILVVGVVQELLQRQVKIQGWPKWGMTLWIMGCTLGLLGGLVVIMRLVARRAMAHTHKVASSVPILSPLILHLLVLAVLFLLYAWVWKHWPPFAFMSKW